MAAPLIRVGTHEHALTPFGAVVCRICYHPVKVEPVRGMHPGCARKVANGLKVERKPATLIHLHRGPNAIHPLVGERVDQLCAAYWSNHRDDGSVIDTSRSPVAELPWPKARAA